MNHGHYKGKRLKRMKKAFSARAGRFAEWAETVHVPTSVEIAIVAFFGVYMTSYFYPAPFGAWMTPLRWVGGFTNFLSIYALPSLVRRFSAWHYKNHVYLYTVMPMDLGYFDTFNVKNFVATVGYLAGTDFTQYVVFSKCPEGVSMLVPRSRKKIADKTLKKSKVKSADVTNKPDIVYPLVEASVRKHYLRKVPDEFMRSMTADQRSRVGAMVLVG